MPALKREEQTVATDLQGAYAFLIFWDVLMVVPYKFEMMHKHKPFMRQFTRA